MTDTGQVPGEGVPENAGMVEQPGVSAPGAYTFLDPSETPAEDDDLLLMPGAQGAWGNEVPPPAPMPLAHEPGAQYPHESAPQFAPESGPQLGQEPAPQFVPEPAPQFAAEPGPLSAPEPGPQLGQEADPQVAAEPGPQLSSDSGPLLAPDSGPQLGDEPGPHETAGRDSGSVDLSGVRMPAQAPAPQPTPPRRPLHLGPPTPDGSSSPVRSLADRGPAGAPAGAVPVRQSGPPTMGPEYLDVPQLADVPPQGAPWGAAPQSVPSMAPTNAEPGAEGQAAETVVPEHAPSAEAGPGDESPQVTEAQFDPGSAPAGQPAEIPPAVGIAESPQAAPASPDAWDAAPGPLTPEAHPAAEDPETAQAPDAVPVAETGASIADGGPDAHVAPLVEPLPDAFATGQDAAQSAGDSALPDGIQPSAPAAPHASSHAAAPEPASPEGEFTAPAQDPYAAQPPVPDLALTPAEPGTHDAAVPFADPADTGVHIPEPVVQFADTGSYAEPEQAVAAPQPPAAEVSHPAGAVHAVHAPVPVDASQGRAVAASQAPHAHQLTESVAEPSYGVPVGVGAYAAPARAAAGQEPDSAGRAHGPTVPGDSAELSGAPLEVQADHTIGRFVPVEGSVPTTPHLAPTPPHAMTVPPLPAEEDSAPDEQPAPGLTPAATEPPAFEETPEPLAAAQSLAPAEFPAPEDPVAVPAPREAEAALVPEPPVADLESVVAQQADDLDTQGADQEESTAAVEDVRESTGPAAPGYDEAEREAVLRVMRERRDIRNGFRSDPIPHDVLLRVLEAAHTAPSVGHSQPWDFVVIRSADTRRAMHELAARQREAYAKSLPKGRAKQFKELKIEAILDTPVNIVVTADPTRGGRHTLGRHTQPQMAPYSSALAVENLWLAARAEGLGVGWVSFFDEREMVRALGLPDHLEVVAYLCVGYVDEFPDEPELMQAGWSKRRPLSWVVHEETYGRRALPGEEPHDLLAETVSNIRPLDAKALGEAWDRQKRMTKPAGALGMLEIISAQLSGLSRQCPPPIPEPAAVAIFAGDHGVHAQGVTPWPQEVTAQMVANFLGGGAVCNAFANQVGAEVCVIDVGVASELPATPGLLPRKIRAGTSDMTTGPAMTREEAKAAIEVGIETARDLVAAGNRALLTGEMGIANTTASAALISVFTGTDPSEVTGRGTGINDETLARKTEVVRRALEVHQPDPADPIGVLAAVGGFEHAALVGLLLGGASLRTPVILDGVSAGAAALVARAIAPEVLAACIAGHRSAEPGHVAALNKLGLRPLVDLDLRLGEGTGALLALPMVQSTARAMHEVATFDSAGVTEK
ncbi:nicotinate-nucleotide--dimethylbenzimidazole phosphoribosyltransferase [Streptomyces sp. NPDC058371]|uniref:nicotinate-nucleotide--dimethylbenzimidazole phosphoribosyltransferase n=1 Tax=Streptomyces sp. NPDC058371 TaxID=3346463 RepID=UPI003663FFA9